MVYCILIVGTSITLHHSDINIYSSLYFSSILTLLFSAKILNSLIRADKDFRRILRQDNVSTIIQRSDINLQRAPK